MQLLLAIGTNQESNRSGVDQIYSDKISGAERF